MTLNSYSLKHHSNKYQPYVYYVFHRPTRQYYVGCRYAKGCNPKELWKTYFTSSKRIHKLIEEYGHESFFYFCFQKCNTREEALELEAKLIETLYKEKDCLNLCKSGTTFSGTLPGTPKSLDYRIRQSKRLKGKKVSQKWKDSHSKTWKVITPDGSTLIVKNLQEWCKQNKELQLWPQNLRDVAKGRYKQYKGYKCELVSEN